VKSDQSAADLYLTKQNTHNRQISMPQAVFDRAVLASERSRTTP